MAFPRTALACGIAAALGSAQPVFAADSDIEAIRNEIKQIKDSYEARINALEQRLKAAEAKAEKARAAQPPQAKEAASAPSASAAQAGRARQEQRVQSRDLAHLGCDIPKLAARSGNVAHRRHHPGGEELGPGERSFNLGESELNIRANIDPYFYGSFTVAVTPENEVEVEEAYFSTLRLPAGDGVGASSPASAT